MPGLGQKSLEEVRVRLAERGWSLFGDGDEEGEEDTGDMLLGEGDGYEFEEGPALLGAEPAGEGE